MACTWHEQGIQLKKSPQGPKKQKPVRLYVPKLLVSLASVCTVRAICVPRYRIDPRPIFIWGMGLDRPIPHSLYKFDGAEICLIVKDHKGGTPTSKSRCLALHTDEASLSLVLLGIVNVDVTQGHAKAPGLAFGMN